MMGIFLFAISVGVSKAHAKDNWHKNNIKKEILSFTYLRNIFYHENCPPTIGLFDENENCPVWIASTG